jgi:hypothetical protein
MTPVYDGPDIGDSKVEGLAKAIADSNSEISEHEIFFALNDAGTIGVGFTPSEAAECLLSADDTGCAIRSFSIRVRARKPGVELGPEIDIADKDVEVATVAEGKTVVTILSDDPEYAAAQKGTLPEVSRASHQS